MLIHLAYSFRYMRYYDGLIEANKANIKEHRVAKELATAEKKSSRRGDVGYDTEAVSRLLKAYFTSSRREALQSRTVTVLSQVAEGEGPREANADDAARADNAAPLDTEVCIR